MQRNNRPVTNLKKRVYDLTPEEFYLTLGSWIIISLVILIIIASLLVVAGSPNSNFPY